MPPETEYPGLEFTPPSGSVGDALEGEALVSWKKVGDKYTIVEFEGEPIQPKPPTGPPSTDSMSELSEMDEEGM